MHDFNRINLTGKGESQINFLPPAAHLFVKRWGQKLLFKGNQTGVFFKKSLIFCFLIGFVFFTCTGTTQEKDNVTLKGKIDRYMKRLTETGFSGALLVSKDNHIILAKGYGPANREKKIPVTKDTVFTIGSITKQFTGAAILKLQMQGKLDVNDPIVKYFKNVPEDKKAITLHHMLTHTAGFPGAIGDDYDPIESDEFITLAMKTKLVHKPGQKYRYSNVGYSLLGIIVESVSGQSYEKYLHDNLFEPAGMMDTGYLLPQWEKDRLAHGYRGGKDWGTLPDHPWAKDGPGRHLRANGGILSTLGDMLKWHQALLGNKILDEKARALYYKPHVPEDEAGSSHYGYGWAIFKTRRNTRLIAHNGGNMIFAADFLRYLDEGVVIIAFSNTAGHPAFRAGETVARIVFGEPYSLPLKNKIKMTGKQLHESPMGIHAAALIDSMGKPKAVAETFIKKHMEPDVAKAKWDRLIGFITQEDGMLGEVEFGEAVQGEENKIEIKIRSKKSGEWWLLGIGFEKKSPHRIVSISIDDTSPPGKPAAGGEEEKSRDKPKSAIEVTVDPRVELFSTIFRLAGLHEYNQDQLPLYVKDVKEYFKPYKDHEAVKYAKKLKKSRSICYNAPMGLAIHVTDTETLGEIVPLDPLPETVDKRWTPKHARQFLEKAGKFVKDTNFHKFFKDHKELYDLSVSRMDGLLQNYKVVEWFKTFFGTESGKTFSIILGMQNGGPSYGPRIVMKDGKEIVYAIIGVWQKDDKGFPDFPRGFLGTVVHEFCHSFANPLVDQFATGLKEAGKKIYPFVADEMKQMAYGSWRTMMYESLVRACTARYYHDMDGPDAAKRIVQREIERSFLWMDGLYKLLADYDSQRETYPTLSAYFPKIIDFFNRYAQNIEKEIALQKEARKKKWEQLAKKAPKIIAMVPENGARDVDPGLEEIKITFDRPMLDKAWAVIRLDPEHHIKTAGEVGYDTARKVFTIPVELEPDRRYKFGLNYKNIMAFQDENKNPLLPVVVTFKTRKEEK